jgi:hypothetical protein
MTESSLIEIPIYRNDRQEPVCYSADFRCVFLDIRKYGVNTCRATNTNPDDVRCGAKDAVAWSGYRPHENCPLWKNKV